MREIKFRFWNKIARRFQPPSKYAVDGEGKLVAYDYEMMAYDDPVDFSNTCIVAQQYTGLKDKNGVEIYEGDILRYLFDGASYPKEAKNEILICKWEQTNAWYVFNETLEEDSNGYYWLEIKDNCQVIGNIFENPDLLKQ